MNYYASYNDISSSTDAIANNGNVMPTLLRLHGIFDSNDFAKDTDSIGLFFDHKSFSFGFFEINEYGIDTSD